MQNLSYENEFDLHENELESGTHMNGLVEGLVLTETKGNLEMERKENGI